MQLKTLVVIFAFSLSSACGESSLDVTGPTNITPTTPSSPTTPTPTPAVTPAQFSQGMVSITIDDGWRLTYAIATPILDAARLKSTHYVITDRLSHPDSVGMFELRNLESNGHEIGSHSKSHRDLTKLSTDEIREELVGSRTILQTLGIREVRTFAYPFGVHSPSVIQATRDAGYIGARGTYSGFSKPAGDHFNLTRHNLGGAVTLDQVKGWIDQAVQERTWLVFVIHQIDGTPGEYNITQSLFQGITNYLVEKKVRVVTISQGLSLML